MLIGENTHSVDKKGRVAIPQKLRADLGEKFIASRGIGKCIFIFTLDAWENLYRKLDTLPLTDESALEFTRTLFASAVECEPDKQGRILLPEHLREYACLKDEATVIGAMTRVEIWNPDNWQTFKNNAEANYNLTLRTLAGRGI